ncbi:hypothetical protein VE02_03034 [Pseudogymnoascus sp. 03VT05]|nr:hypothetical protein VE02_03034 [Pseudogymnoascus sp. 03VT05]
MTTAHRPTFDPAVGKEAQRGPAYHQRLLPAHTQLKVRKPGQGGSADSQSRDLRAELLAAEAAHFAKTRGGAPSQTSSDNAALAVEAGKRAGGGLLESSAMEGVEDDAEAKEANRRKILEDTRDIDADSASESESDSEDESEDETAELQRELEKIKRERAERREKEEREKEKEEEEERERDVAGGNPLMGGGKQDFGVKRRWDDDVIFRNQARGTEGKDKKEFVNDLLRSDFHKRFMSKYVR